MKTGRGESCPTGLLISEGRPKEERVRSDMRKLGLVFQIAATYIGTIVGAGFASGKEVIQFFTQFGEFGTLGVAASGALFYLDRHENVDFFQSNQGVLF
ncbi:hypothetical protein QS257_17090 [Terrilactibacillus sp. S3-3]|nr:hypothetical protein QS257_17090 [Terrilactibacillus sp. S3-3]